MNDISDELGISVDEFRQKWASLRAQYGRELKNANSTKSGQSTDELYVSNMKFLVMWPNERNMLRECYIQCCTRLASLAIAAKFFKIIICCYIDINIVEHIT